MADLETYLIRTLYRSACPDSMALGEYQMGILPVDQMDAVREHLSLCRFCADEVKSLKDFHTTLASELETPLVERVKTWIARRIDRLLPQDTSGGLTPSFQVRGEIDKVLAYQAGEAQLSLAIESDPHNPDRRALTGLLIGAPLEGIHVNLFQRERMSTVGLVDDLGGFTIMGVKPGQYELVLRGSAFEIYISPLRIE